MKLCSPSSLWKQLDTSLQCASPPLTRQGRCAMSSHSAWHSKSVVLGWLGCGQSNTQWPLTIMILNLQMLWAGNSNQSLDELRELLQSPADSTSEDDVYKYVYPVIIPRIKLKMRTIHKYLSMYIQCKNDIAVTLYWYNECSASQWVYMTSSIYIASPTRPLPFFASGLKCSCKTVWTVRV